MTASQNAPAASTPVQVRFTAAGRPLAVRYQDQVWAVAADPFHWFTRSDWWKQGHSATRGSGDLVSVEFWRVQVRLTASASLRTFTLRREPSSDTWVLDEISDAA